MSRRPAWWDYRHDYEPDGVALVNDDMPGEHDREDEDEHEEDES
jgi:hypothetical protein